MITRHLKKPILEAAKNYPVLLITGPRQSGKTTLARDVFSGYKYFNLEFPDTRSYAKDDPRNFLSDIGKGIIIDEVQYAPELLSYIQGMVDDQNLIGKVILTGSQNINIMEQVTQSLAGRVAIFELLPLSYLELKEVVPFNDINKLLFQGQYPRQYDQPDLDIVFWLKNYTQTYIQRDVRQLVNLRDIDKFSVFLKLCAGRIGQLVNYAALGNEAGLDAKTVAHYVNVLKENYILFTLAPYYKNFNKRLVKTPKIYFYDTGLACSLLGINTAESLKTHYMNGALFENWVLTELYKLYANQALAFPFYFWRDRTGNEIDILLEREDNYVLTECKYASTYHSSFFKMNQYWDNLNLKTPFHSAVMYGGNESLKTKHGNLYSWKDFEKFAYETMNLEL